MKTRAWLVLVLAMSGQLVACGDDAKSDRDTMEDPNPIQRDGDDADGEDEQDGDDQTDEQDGENPVDEQDGDDEPVGDGSDDEQDGDDEPVGDGSDDEQDGDDEPVGDGSSEEDGGDDPVDGDPAETVATMSQAEIDALVSGYAAVVGREEVRIGVCSVIGLVNAMPPDLTCAQIVVECAAETTTLEIVPEGCEAPVAELEACVADTLALFEAWSVATCDSDLSTLDGFDSEHCDVLRGQCPNVFNDL